MRKTKIICTLGPATEKPETIRRLIARGADVFRLNMSHAPPEWVREIVPRIRKLADELGRPIGILLDTQGPAIRTGPVKTPLELKKGDVLEFTVGRAKKTEKKSVEVNYDKFADDVSVGDTVLVDNGLIKLVVIEKKKNRVLCKVITPAALGSRRHINLPGVHVSLPPLTKKDIADVGLGAELGVDFVALSFVRKAGDLVELRNLLARKKSKAQVLAKIEDQAAVESIEDIIKTADLVMVARGDLGIEVPMEELPIIQRRIVKSCIRLGKPVIVATHLLESMIKNRVPTRIERSGGAGYAESAILEDSRQKTVASAVVLANSLARSKLIVFTRHGRMARNTSNLRPQRATVFAFTPSEEVRRQLSICWGVCPIQIEFSDDPNVTIETAQKCLRDQKLTTAGDNLVIISDVRARDALVDCVQLRTAK